MLKTPLNTINNPLYIQQLKKSVLSKPEKEESRHFSYKVHVYWMKHNTTAKQCIMLQQVSKTQKKLRPFSVKLQNRLVCMCLLSLVTSHYLLLGSVL